MGHTGPAVEVLDTPSLGDRSYLVHDGRSGVVIDPQRDIERVVDLAEESGVTISHVVETHIHNDYVTGGLAVAQAVGATYLLPDGESGSFVHDHASDGQQLTVGALRLVVLHTPGHTPTHVAYLAFLDDTPIGVFTGGSMLYGAVGRTDLIGADLTRQLTLAQHASVRSLAKQIDDTVAVFPTHGFGSHCSSGTSDIHRSGSIGDERTRNPALLEDDAQTFADRLIGGFGPYPSYYARMGPLNLRGPSRVAQELPQMLSGTDVARALTDGTFVVDLRPRGQFAAGHLPGSVNVELRNDLPTYLGWVHDGAPPIVLLGPDEEAIREAQIMLARIGYDDLYAALIGSDGRLDGAPSPVGYPRVGWHEVNTDRAADAIVLDVRDESEWDSGHHSAAIHIPFHEVLDRIEELPPPSPVLVYCATGNRAAVAASQLALTGRDVSLVDDFCLPGDIPG